MYKIFGIFFLSAMFCVIAPKAKAGSLEDLLREEDESLTNAENAFIIGKALGTPGGINAKINAAREMANPVIRDRRDRNR
jgi:hypothetical protein